MLFQIQAHLLPKHVRKPQAQLVPVQLVRKRPRLNGIRRQTHQTRSRVLPLETGPGLNLLPQVLDNLQWRVVLHQEIQRRLVLVNQAANGRRNDLPQVRIHHKLNRQIAYLLKYQSLVNLLLHRWVLQAYIPQKHYDLVQQQL